MIKKYVFGDTTQLSPHFNVKEFRCKCGKEHDFEVNEKLVENLEKLYESLNCSKIIVTSGYRCIAILLLNRTLSIAKNIMNSII